METEASLLAMGFPAERVRSAMATHGADLVACAAWLADTLDGSTDEDAQPASEPPAKRAKMADASGMSGSTALPGPKLGFHLSTLHRAWIEAGLVGRRCNEGTLSITDLLSADSLCGCTELHIVNFMIDVRRWLPISSPGSSALLLLTIGLWIDTCARSSTLSCTSAPRCAPCRVWS